MDAGTWPVSFYAWILDHSAWHIIGAQEVFTEWTQGSLSLFFPVGMFLLCWWGEKSSQETLVQSESLRLP